MLEPFYWLNEDSIKFLRKGYLHKGERAISRFALKRDAAAKILNKNPEFAAKFWEYLGRGYYSLATPVILNFGEEKGLPCSCNGSYIPDSMYGILRKQSEVGSMTCNGAGTSAYFGDVRPRGSDVRGGEFKTHGSVHFMEMFDNVTNIVSQGSARRGSFAAYLPIDHPDIEEFLLIQSEGHPIKTMSFGVCVKDQWMEEMIAGDIQKQTIWGKVLQKRSETGYPYIFFTDTANNAAPQVYKDKGLKIHASNLCSEIALSSGEDESFVCNLSSINLLHWDEIKDTDAVEVLIFFLDAVMEEYIRKTEGIPFMEAAHNFAKRQRALGLGVLGWHSYLQSKNVAFESFEAKMLNAQIFKTIRQRCDKATEELARLYGEPELLVGYGRRNVTTMAVAPTTSSSFILGQVSPSIEPLRDNYFVKKLAKGSFTYKNPFLLKLLDEKGQNTDAVWRSILEHGGSVQHLDFLSENEKDVFKTFSEISPKEIIIQAAARQKEIDQGQSLNLLFHPDMPVHEMNWLMIFGWKMKLKSFYYTRGANPSQEVARNILTCRSCEA